MTAFKLVNGVAVPLSDAELSARQAEEAAFVAGSVDRARAAALRAIDNQAGVTRIKYITPVAGQAETYLAKANDAQVYKTAGYPAASIANYPLVQAEAVALYGATPTAAQFQAAADGILATQSQWIAKAAQIEQQRRAGKIAVTAAMDVAAINAARDTAIAALVVL